MAKSKKKRKSIPYQYKPEGLDLKTWQILLRRQAAVDEKLSISSDEDNNPGTYHVINPKTQQEYKVVYRGAKSPWNYCSCMDFKTSQLGTCKHIEAVKRWIHSGHRVHHEIPSYSSVYLDYTEGRKVRFRIGTDHEAEFRQLASEYFDGDGNLMPQSFLRFETFLHRAKAIDETIRCYNDALDYVLATREKEQRRKWVDSLGPDDFAHLLNTTLYPYQEEGIRFAAKAGRAIIADEMGLGKTIQAIGTAMLLRNKGLIGSVLVLCPTSLKYQWKREIEHFSNEKAHVIEGNHLKRREQYYVPELFKIVSYNSACNDIKVLGSLNTDMVIIDEVQRLKNWNTQIARAARKINSDYAVILSGTPLENRLEELYSVVELADQYCLGPYYLFRDHHIITDDKGATIGYKNLHEIKDKLKSILIRRTKKQVRLQMPARQDKTLLVPMTEEQMEVHDEAKSMVRRLLLKWERLHFLSESDRNRLMMFLQQMRCVCDSTYILDQKTRYDTKVDEVMNIISNIVESGDEKVVIFSQWERMTRLIAEEMRKHKIGFEYLYGGVPSARRKDLVNNFIDKPDCRVFLSTDAGSTGLNLQVASIIINMDLPWNPAVLEQRIARIYRIGQQRNIQVVNLVSASSFEEAMLGKLKFKASLFAGVLDNGQDTIFASESKFDELVKDIKETVDGTDSTEAASVTMDEVEHSTEEPNGSNTSTEKEDESQETVMRATEDTTEQTDKATGNSERDISAKDESYNPSLNESQDDTGELNDKHCDDFHDGHSEDLDERQGKSPSRHNATRSPRSPQELVAEGVSFFSGLTKTLESPEATRELVDSIVDVDKDTGETTLKIPVPDKESVVQMFGALSKLFTQLSSSK